MKIQKKAVRIITLSKYNSHTEPLFKKLNTLKVEVISNVPDLVIDKTHSLKGFSSYAKNYLLQKYNDSCTMLNCYICQLS